jgi:hypothetical protein
MSILGLLALALAAPEAKAQVPPTADLIWVGTDGPGSGLGTNTLIGVQVGDLVTLHIVVTGGDLGLFDLQNLTLEYDSNQLSGAFAGTCPNPPNPGGPTLCDDPLLGGALILALASPTINEIGPGSTMSPFSVLNLFFPTPFLAPLTMGEATYQVLDTGAVSLLYQGTEVITDGVGQSHFPPASAFIAVEPPTIPVEVDIKPGSDPNSINPLSRGVIPVAILGTDTFDVADVDVTTLAFGPDGAPLAHRNGPHVKDANHDGIDDLLAHFLTEEAGIALGDEEACATGETLDGTPFEGCDSVRTVPPRGV